MDRDIGFIGLGQMGQAIAERMVRPGRVLHVHDPAPAAMAHFTRLGAVGHDSPAAVAGAATVVFACLPNGAVSLDAALGDRGVVRGTACEVYVEMSTIGMAVIERIAAGLAAAGKALLDAPVSGGPRGARKGSLAIMAGGGDAALARVEPLLREVAGRLFHVGAAPGMGQAMKLTNNMISATNMASTFECLVFGAKAGLDPATMVEVINASTGRNSASQDKVPQSVLPGTFDYGARLETMYKDIRLGLEEAERLGVPMWSTSTIREIWRFAMTQGGGDDDFTGLIRYMERWAGVEVRSGGERE